MPYMGTLQAAQPIRLESVSDLPSGAVTIFWLKPGGILDIELLPGTIAPHDHTIPRRTSRISFEVATRVGGSILFKASQGGTVVDEVIVSGDAIFVFDVV